MGYKFSNKGTTYMIDAIEFVYNSNNYMELLSNMSENVYSKIAKKYNVNLGTLESNITKATDNMNKFRQAHYSTKIKDKITSKTVIWLILDKINNT